MTTLGILLREAAGVYTWNWVASLTQRWLTENLLDPVQEVSDKGIIDWHAYIPTHIKQCMREKTSWLYVNHPYYTAVRIAKLLLVHDLQFMHPKILLLLQYNSHNIISDADCFSSNATSVVEMVWWKVRYDLQLLPKLFRNKQIFTIARSRSSRSNDMERSSGSRLSPECLLVFKSLIIYIIIWRRLL